MKKRKNIGIIALLVLILAYLAAYFLFNIHVLQGIIASMDWPHMLLSMLLYAIAPGAAAAIMRLKFDVYARRWIPPAATIASALCMIVIVIGPVGSANEWVSDFAQYALVSAAPALYCAAFVGAERRLWIAFVPSLLYFSSFFVRCGMLFGFAGFLGVARHLDLQFILNGNPDPSILTAAMTAILMSAVFAAWALLCVFVSHMAYRIGKAKKN